MLRAFLASRVINYNHSLIKAYHRSAKLPRPPSKPNIVHVKTRSHTVGCHRLLQKIEKQQYTTSLPFSWDVGW